MVLRELDRLVALSRGSPRGFVWLDKVGGNAQKVLTRNVWEIIRPGQGACADLRCSLPARPKTSPVVECCMPFLMAYFF